MSDCIEIRGNYKKCIQITPYKPQCIVIKGNLPECNKIEGIRVASYDLAVMKGFFWAQVEGVDENGDCFPVLFGTYMRMGGGIPFIIDVTFLNVFSVTGGHGDGIYDLYQIASQGLQLKEIYIQFVDELNNLDLTGTVAEKVWINDNGLTTLPTGSNNLLSLDVNNNEIEGSFDDLASPNLWQLWAHNNKLDGSGELPCSMLDIDLRWNEITEENLTAILERIDTCGLEDGTLLIAEGNEFDPWKTEYALTEMLVNDRGWYIDGEPFPIEYVYTVRLMNFTGDTGVNFYTSGNLLVLNRWLKKRVWGTDIQDFTLDASFPIGDITNITERHNEYYEILLATHLASADNGDREAGSSGVYAEDYICAVYPPNWNCQWEFDQYEKNTVYQNRGLLYNEYLASSTYDGLINNLLNDVVPTGAWYPIEVVNGYSVGSDSPAPIFSNDPEDWGDYGQVLFYAKTPLIQWFEDMRTTIEGAPIDPDE